MNTIGKNISLAQPWLKNSWVDGVFILSPPFVALIIVTLFPGSFKNSEAMPLMYWVILIVMIDVVHVYSTLYRTYFQPLALKQQPYLLIIPVCCYLIGIALYSISSILFWRLLAYLAVFHFIQQQYGFMRLYSRKEKYPAIYKMIDTVTIYTATIYPLLYWHLAGNRKFNWFIDGDFLSFQIPYVLQVSAVLYLLIILIYLIKEICLTIQNHEINMPRNLLVLGTLLSWYFGIVFFNGDMAFTTLNVVSHGIPYMALVWVAEQKRVENHVQVHKKIWDFAFSKYTGVLFFIVVLVVFAYIEEGLWDGFVWREHLTFFNIFRPLPVIHDSFTLAFLVPLLALPQSTHYVLDGFIWKMRKSKEF